MHHVTEQTVRSGGHGRQMPLEDTAGCHGWIQAPDAIHGGPANHIEMHQVAAAGKKVVHFAFAKKVDEAAA